MSSSPLHLLRFPPPSTGLTALSMTSVCSLARSHCICEQHDLPPAALSQQVAAKMLLVLQKRPESAQLILAVLDATIADISRESHAAGRAPDDEDQ